MSIRILIADDHMIVRQGLRLLLEKMQDMEVIAEAANGYEAIRLAHELHPDVIIMDMQMPEMDGVDAARKIMKNDPAIKIIILSMMLDRACVAEALKAGVKGYVVKDCAAENLVDAIRTAMTGFPYLCREVTELLIMDYTRTGEENSNDSQVSLNSREREVLQFIAEGKNAKEIAYQLCLSVKTIESQRIKIMKRLDLYSVAELTRYAVRIGLVSA